jgi:hypothetical protein
MRSFSIVSSIEGEKLPAARVQVNAREGKQGMVARRTRRKKKVEKLSFPSQSSRSSREIFSSAN